MPARSKKSSFAVAAAAALLLAAAPGAARADLSEDFGPYGAAGAVLVPAGWTVANLSSPVGSTTWFQGNPPSGGGPFVSHQGAEHAYIAANFNSTTGSNGTISNWLITPRIETLTDGDEVSFFTRRAAPTPGNQVFPDRLELRLSTNGTCNPGATTAGVGDFTTLLTTVNPNLTADDWPTGYPAGWTEVRAVLRGLPADARGCVAFRYHVTSAGPSGTLSDYIGIDTFRFTDDVTPPPAPTLDAVAPASPSNDPAPRARGTAEAFSTVRIYGDETCTGPLLGSGSAEDLADGGIAFDATPDAVTTPYATATDGSANLSPCSAAGPAYDHDGIAPETTDDVTDATLPGDAVTLDATDGDGSGVAATHYEVGADPATPTTASPLYDPASKPVLAGGERIRYFSVDAAGNEEAPRSSQVVVAPQEPGGPGDGTDPETPGGPSDGGDPTTPGGPDTGRGPDTPTGPGPGPGSGSDPSTPAGAGGSGPDDVPLPPRETGPAGPLAPKLALAGRGLVAPKSGVVPARLGCTPRTGGDGGGCRGAVRLTVTQRVAGKNGRRVRKVLVLARGRFTLRAAGTARLRLKLTPAARRLLARAPRRGVAVRLVVDARDGSGARAQVTFKRTLRRR